MLSPHLQPQADGTRTAAELLARNGLLRRAPGHVREQIARVATRRRVMPRQDLSQDGGRLAHVRFIEAGAVSLVGSLPDGSSAEVGLVGPDSMIGAAEILAGVDPACSALAQTECDFAEVPVERFLEIMDLEPTLHEIVRAQAARSMEDGVRISVCHSRHSLQQRLASWIEAMDGHLGGQPICTTHREIAGLVCARRATVTELIHILEGDGAIRSRRGWITVRDREALREAACGCRR